MNTNKFFSKGIGNVKPAHSLQKLMLLLISTLLMSVSSSLFASASAIVSGVSDTVPCAPQSVPYSEAFDTCDATGLLAVGVLPDCWETVFSGTDTRYAPHVTNASEGVIVGNSLVISSSNNASIGNGNYAVLPSFTSNLNGVRFSFKAKKQFWLGPNYDFSFGYFNGDLLPENFVPLENIDVPDSNCVSSFSFALNGHAIPEGARLAFCQKGGVSTSFYVQTYIDSVTIEFLDCSPVTQVQVSDVMMNSAHITWTPGSWETAWRVEYGESGFAKGTGMVLNTTEPYADLTDLNGETLYDIYVQAVCDPANMSDYSDTISFYTYCAVYGDTTVAEVCDSYVWRDSVYTYSGTFYDTLSRVADASCDSIYTLELIVHESAYQFDTLMLCQSQLPYTWRDTTFDIGSVDSNFIFVDTTVYGCDSVVELALFIFPSYYEDRFDTICENELPYTWNDTVFDAGTVSGDYLFSRNSELGCDSTIVLHLIVNKSYNQLELLRICSHELPYVWRDTTFGEGTESGVYTFSRYSQHGCDSLVTLALYVLASDTVFREDTICASELPYTWNDTTFLPGTETGYYMITGGVESSCESTLLHLVVGGIEQDIEHPDTLRICQNELPYVWQANLGDVYFGTETTRGLRRVVISAGGCTDIYFLYIDLIPSQNVELSKTICSSQLPYTLADTTFRVGTQSGTYYVTRPASNGCDKVTTINLTVNPAYEIYDTLIICSSELPYHWNNEWLQVGMTTGNYTYNRTSHLGCDSVVHLYLVVNRSYSETHTLSVCENELPIEWRGHVFPRGTQSRSFVYSETSVTGCDSVVLFSLTVNPICRQEENLTICSGDLPYVWRDTTFEEGTLGGTYMFEKQSIAGCDSIVVLHLTVNPTKEEFVTLDICRSDLPYHWRDTSFNHGTTSDIFTFNRYTSTGCDSVVTLALNVHESFGSNETLEVCENDLPYEWRGNIIPRGTVSGNLVYRDQTSYGCDSIVILSIVVNPVYQQNESLTICENDLPYQWRDTIFNVGTRSGVFSFERVSSTGCDSVVNLSLIVNPSYQQTAQLVICESELPYVYGDTTFEQGTVSGTYVLERATEYGCDSVVTLNLTVNPIYDVSDEVSICETDLPYIYYDTVFGLGTQSGAYVFHRHTLSGCDSTVTLSLTVYPQGYQLKQYEICSSELPYETEDTTFMEGTSSGMYNIYYSGSTGCDSIVAISLTVHPVYSTVISEVICENDLPYEWRDTTFQVGTRSGVYQFTRSSEFGCDSVVTLALIVNQSYDVEETESVCDNGFPFVWRDTTFLAGTTSGEFVFYRHTVNGCDSIVTLHLTVNPTYNQTEQLSICQSDLPYVWRDTTFQTATTSGFYTFHRLSSTGCDSVVTLALTVLPSSIQYYNVRICSNDLPYTWSVTDTIFDENTTSGIYHFNYMNVTGCDSTIVLNLTVNQSYETYESLTLCQNELPYYYEPGNYTFSTNATSGSYPFIHETASGCDSTIILQLIVHPSYMQQEMISVCENDFPYTWRDTTFMEGTVSGTYVFNRTSQYGCDSVVSLMLAVSPLPSVSITQIPNGSMTTLVCSSSGNCSYLWSTGDNLTVITVPSDSAMTYTVTATNITTGCSNTASISIGTGIDDNEEVSHNVIVYPNPTDGKVTVDANGEMISEIRVFALDGRMVRRVLVDDTSTELDFDMLANGVYLMHIQMQQGDVARKKLIVQ